MTSHTEQANEYIALLKSQMASLSKAIAEAQSLNEWDSRPPSGITAVAWYEEFAERLIRTKKAFLITSPDVNALLEQTRKYRSVIDNNLSGVYQTGTLDKVLVFVDPFFPMDRILLGNGSLDDPENLVIRNPVTLRATNLLDKR